MRFSNRYILTASSMAVAVCIWLSQTSTARDTLHSMTSFLESDSTVAKAGKSAAELENEARQTKRRVQIKRSVIQDLIEQRINLEQATEIFVELNNAPPRSCAAMIAYPRLGEKVATALQVMLHARAFLKEDGQPYPDDVFTRLESQLQDLQDSLGSVELVEHRVQ